MKAYSFRFKKIRSLLSRLVFLWVSYQAVDALSNSFFAALCLNSSILYVSTGITAIFSFIELIPFLFSSS
jgi:hypothetical protein